MSNLLTLNNISHGFSDKELFSKLKLNVSSNDKIGIIGANGTGKSTLLKIIANHIEVDSGEIIRARDINIAYLSQEDNFNEDITVIEEFNDRLKDKLDEVEREIIANKFLYSAGFDDLNVKISSLSGGFKKRLSLSILFASKADLLLLDEPTNHLDFEGLIWIEKLLKESKKPWIMVSHDRYLLDRTVNSIAEIASFYEDNVLKLDCSYLEFLENRDIFLNDIQNQISKLKNKFRNEKDWVSRMPKARGTKANYRVKAFSELEEKLKNTKALLPKLKKKVNFSESDVDSKLLAQFINVSFFYSDKKVISSFDYKVENNKKIGVLGKNGQGKSTILKLLVGELKPNTGKTKLKDNLSIVYFDQLKDKINPEDTLKYIIAEGSDHVIYHDKPIHYISYGKRFGFELIDFDKKYKALSGGQKARLLLSILARQSADLLVLDEPTNDLDIEMLETLESMIHEFSGSVMLVSHDRFLLNNCCNIFIGFTDEGEIKEFSSYEQWSRLVFSETKATLNKEKIDSKQKNNASYQERKEYSKIPNKIEKLEAKINSFKLELEKPEVVSDAKKSLEIYDTIEKLEDELTNLYDRWEELESLIGV